MYRYINKQYLILLLIVIKYTNVRAMDKSQSVFGLGYHPTINTLAKIRDQKPLEWCSLPYTRIFNRGINPVKIKIPNIALLNTTNAEWHKKTLQAWLRAKNHKNKFFSAK
ncbi:MAG: hypothetical protein ACOYT8_00350 [Candidatus Dependentiae bacterium]